jgi:hypothetical protein
MFPDQIVLTPDQIGDLSNASPYLRQTWMAARESHAKALKYYSGDIFRELVETEQGQKGSPLLYPIGVNLVKMLTLTMADAAFGEWEEGGPIILFEPNNLTGGENSIDRQAAVYLAQVLDDSNAQSMLWELDFDRNLYGAAVMRITTTFPLRSHVRWVHVPIDGFYPVFDPEDPDVIIECWYVSQISPEQAKQRYGIEAEGKSYLVKVEHWTQFLHETTVDGRRIDGSSGINPYAVVPFVYIPRMRTTDWWGESLAGDIYAPQDELNMRLADVSDALNYHMHPIFYGSNLPKNFNATNFPIAPWAFWDFGRTMGNNKPEVAILETEHAVSPQAFEYVKFLYDWTRTSSFAPPIAFGEDDGGGQRSGATLEIRLWPLLKALRRSRAYMTTGIKRAMHITGRMLAQKKFSDLDSGIAKVLYDRALAVGYHRILPRERSSVVDEVVKLSELTPPQISMETAQAMLGRGLPEVSRIIKGLEQLGSQDEVLAVLERLRGKQSAQNQAMPGGIHPRSTPDLNQDSR